MNIANKKNAVAASVPEFVRFESASGHGLFEAWSLFADEVAAKKLRLKRSDARELEYLRYWLQNELKAPPVQAYGDRLARRPRTWFKSTAKECLAKAQRMCELMNRYGADIREVRTGRPGLVLWEDEQQVIVRPHRQKARSSRNVPFGTAAPRHRDRTSVRLARGRRRLGL